MIIERTKNASRNIAIGSFSRLYSIIMQFAMRTVVLYFLGIQYLGLNGLFASIIQVLSLAELGVSAAMVYSMYEPIARDDDETICALLNLYKKLYRIIGMVILVAGLIIIPVLPYLVAADLPSDVNLYTIYLLNLGATVLSYWLFSYKTSLFQAFQRNDIQSSITIVTNTIQYILQLYALIVWKSYYLYLIAKLFCQVLTNLSYGYISKKKYAKYIPKGKLPEKMQKQITGQIKDLFTAKLGNVLANSMDTLVVSSVLGLSLLAIYQNYYFIITSVIGFMVVVYQGCTAGIGNSLFVKSEETNYHDFKTVTMLIICVLTFCCACFLSLFQPFIILWTGEENMLSYACVIAFSAYFFVFEMNQLFDTYKDAAGIWHQDRFRPLIVAILNLIMNILLAKILGVLGIILGTVLSYSLISIPWILLNIFNNIFSRNYFKDYCEFLFVAICKSVIIMGMVAFVCSFSLPNQILEFGIKLVICGITSAIFCMLLFRKNSHFLKCIELLRKIVLSKIRR